MKKWHKVLLIIVAVIAALAVAGCAVYKIWFEPIVDDKIGEVAVKMSEIINSESFQSKIDEMAQSMMDDGVIKPEDVPTYNKLKLENEAKRRANEEAAERTLEQLVEEEKGETQKKTGNKNESAANGDNADKTGITSKGKNPDKNEATDKVEKPETPNKGKVNNTQKPEQEPQVVVKEETKEEEKVQKEKEDAPSKESNSTKKDLQQKLKEAMSPDEFAFALSMYGRIDIGYAQSLLNSNRAAAKEYIYSKASPAEISRALEIYAKYSYLLQ